MTIPPDSVLRTLDHDGLTALAEADTSIDVAGSIARIRELLDRGPSIADLRAQSRDALLGTPAPPDPTLSPITAHRAAALADYARATERRQLAQTPKGTP